MRIYYVVQRFGPQVVGGAEAACRNLARGVARDHEVKVFTTCALEASTWANELPEGSENDDGVEVIRFPTDRLRATRFEAKSARLFRNPSPSRRLQERWIEDQGPESRKLIKEIRRRKHDPDLWVFYTYLYYPTLFGLPHVAPRAVLHPALHEEPAANLPMVREVVRSAAGLSLQTPEEWALTLRLIGWPKSKMRMVGMGVDEGKGDTEAFRSRYQISAPFILYLGRVDRGKGTDDLARLFAWFKKRHPSNLKLVIAGPIVHSPPAHPDIVVTGRLDDRDRWGALEGCDVFVHPSPFESFGIALIEAWTKSKPAIVNGDCLVTAGHARRSRGGLSYLDAAGFAGALLALLEDPARARELGTNGRAYAEEHFWDQVLTRYETFLTDVAASV